LGEGLTPRRKIANLLRNVTQGLGPEVKRLLGRRRHGWEDNIRMNLRKRFGSCGLDASGSG